MASGVKPGEAAPSTGPYVVPGTRQEADVQRGRTMTPTDKPGQRWQPKPGSTQRTSNSSRRGK